MSDAELTSDTVVAGDGAATSASVPGRELRPAGITWSDSDVDRYTYDVVVVGAGGSGLRAAIEARLHGKKTVIISKSLFGKAHTVMAAHSKELIPRL
jgi:NADPH-dependent 2,4-dienoyl-CoA reductase/sulfur reductase-like enzyme